LWRFKKTAARQDARAAVAEEDRFIPQAFCLPLAERTSTNWTIKSLAGDGSSHGTIQPQKKAGVSVRESTATTGAGKGMPQEVNKRNEGDSIHPGGGILLPHKSITSFFDSKSRRLDGAW
jgi:hypothetical protein